jgi:hypothetical protein
MITIVDEKGNNEIICTKGTYEDVYKRIGYRLASEDKKEATKEVASSIIKEEQKNDDQEKEELSSKYGLKSGKSTASKKKEEK